MKIDKVRDLLAKEGIKEGVDYIFSLQGPTIITTVEGQTKFKFLRESAKEEIESIGVRMMI